MMGLSEIKRANRNPAAYRRSRLSRGQERKENPAVQERDAKKLKKLSETIAAMEQSDG